MNTKFLNRGIFALCATFLSLHTSAAPVHSAAFTIEQILSAPFPSDLVASPDGNHFAWVSNAAGRRNVWLATHRGSGSGYDSRVLTAYAQDDGQDMADLAFVPRHDALLYVRGGDFE